MFRYHVPQAVTTAPSRSPRLPWAHARRAKLAVLAAPAALVLGLLAGLQSPPAAEQASWSLAPVAYADSCQIECCYPAFVTVHTNARKGSLGGPPLQWRSHDLANDHVPVRFYLHYRSCNGGNSTVTMGGVLKPSGNVQFTPLPGYKVNNWCPDKADGQSEFIRVVNVRNWSTSGEACGNVWTSNSPCFTDTDWDLAIAQRLYGLFGPQGQSYFDFIGITAELDPQAADPALFTRSMQGQCSNTDAAPTMLNPGTSGSYGLNCTSDEVCIQAVFN